MNSTDTTGGSTDIREFGHELWSFLTGKEAVIEYTRHVLHQPRSRAGALLQRAALSDLPRGGRRADRRQGEAQSRLRRSRAVSRGASRGGQLSRPTTLLVSEVAPK